MRDEKTALRSEDVREVFEAILPEEELRQIIDKAKFEERSRKRDAVAFLRAMVIAAATGYGGRQRDVARIYFENGAQRVVRGGFYAWFGQELEEAMDAVARRAIAYGASLPLDTPRLLAEYACDFHIVDSSTVKLPIDLFEGFPGAGDYAALKVHKRLSVGLGTVVDKSCSHLDAISARTAPAAQALVHASIVSSMLACLIVHKHRLAERPAPARGAERTTPPLHPQSLARAMGGTALRIAETLALDPTEAAPKWQPIADYLFHLGHDPNWRSRPSVLDQMRGWRISPGRSRRAKIAPSTRKRSN